MKLVKKQMTLEQYEAKYPKYQTRLLSFSDKEIKEFNNKFYKSNGNKQIPDKYALLNKRKWIHIKDRYYQVPRISKLGKCGIALGGAAAVACAVVLPLTLSGVNVSEKEFQLSLTYLSEYSEDRKAACQGTMIYPDGERDTTIKIDSEIEGPKCKVGFIKDEQQTEYVYEYQYVDSDKTIYNYDDFNGVWRRAKKSEGLAIDEAMYTFKDISKYFSKFKKTSKDTYSVKDLKFKMDAPSYPGVQVDVTTDFEVSFNNDKTIKSTKQKVTISTPKSDNNEETEIQTAEMNFNYKEVKTHEIKDFYEFKKPTSESYDLTRDTTFDIYECGAINLIKSIPTTFIICLEDTHSVASFNIQSVILTSNIVKKINKIKSDDTKTSLETSDYTIDDQGFLNFTNPIAYDATDCKKLEIECVFPDDVDEARPCASCGGHGSDQASSEESGQFIVG